MRTKCVMRGETAVFSVPTPVELVATFHKKYGPRDLLEVLSIFGFSCSSYEVQLFQFSLIGRSIILSLSIFKHLHNYPLQIVLGDLFCQWVDDNADVNVDTIDGSNNWHAMGELQCVAPHFSARPLAWIAGSKNVSYGKETEEFESIILFTVNFKKNQAGWP